MTSPGCAETADKYIWGMNPLHKMPEREVNYITKFTPIRDTSFSQMMRDVYYESGGKVCVATPIQVFQPSHDKLLSTKGCKNLARYINDEKYDVEKLEKLLDE